MQIEVATIMFERDDLVWALWRFINEEKVPNLRHTNELIGAYVTAGRRIYLYGNSTACKGERYIVTPTR